MIVARRSGSLGEVNATARSEHDHDLEMLVTAACCLVATDRDVRSVRVLAPERPTYGELRCFQEYAHVQHVRLSLDGGGTVTVRPERDRQN